MKKEIKILAIETSCDETAAAVIEGQGSSAEGQAAPVILSNIVSSQIDLHAKTGGVVPEVASRAHMESMVPVISEALIEAAKNLKFTISNLKSNPNNQMTNQKMNDQWKMINTNYQEVISFLQEEIDYIAVTAGPGLVGSLLVGFNAAKSLAYSLNKPIIAVNHIEGHIYSALSGIEIPNSKFQITNKFQIPNSKNSKLVTDNSQPITEIKFPILSLTVSGGHTSLTLMEDHGRYKNIGQTLDDAAGEAFDKVAKLLDLGYPGGPIVSKLAGEFRTYNENRIAYSDSNKSRHTAHGIRHTELVFPRPILNDGTFNFSFSGLKTAVLQKVLDIKKEINDGDTSPQREVSPDTVLSLEQKMEICAAFEDAVVDVLTTKTIRAAEKYQPKAIILAGGVAANDYLRNVLKLKIENCKLKIDFLLPPKSLCGDNAAMVGLAAYYHIQKNKIDSWDKIKVDSNMEL